MIPLDIFLDTLVLLGHANMLAEMIEPGVLLIKLNIAPRHRNILEYAPAERTIAPADCTELLNSVEKGLALV